LNEEFFAFGGEEGEIGAQIVKAVAVLLRLEFFPGVLQLRAIEDRGVREQGSRMRCRSNSKNT
jgi:hypothetical protein